MSEVKRWVPDDGGMVRWDDRSIHPEYDYSDGTYVRSADYDSLRATVASLREALQDVRETITSRRVVARIDAALAEQVRT